MELNILSMLSMRPVCDRSIRILRLKLNSLVFEKCMKFQKLPKFGEYDFCLSDDEKKRAIFTFFQESDFFFCMVFIREYHQMMEQERRTQQDIGIANSS